VRGPGNDRVYSLKITGRLISGQFVMDVSYSAQRHEPAQIRKLAREIHRWLLQVSGLSPAETPLTVEHGSSIGLLVQVPRELGLDRGESSRREYGTVLITGATGFVGVHLLHLLLTETNSRIVCLVREKGGQRAMERLDEMYSWYMSDTLDKYESRLVVMAADLSAPNFAVEPDIHRGLSLEVDAIFHLAADTRLFGPAREFEQNNTEPVRQLIQLAESGRPKHLHYVSTLAVCGTGPEGATAVFHEGTLAIGQRFLNDYERTKFDAEKLILEYSRRGGSGFVYRLGDVAAHSRTGRFQRNAYDNRFVQVLQAVVASGRFPTATDELIELSPVDKVASSILAIAQCAQIHGGTFHIATDRRISYAKVFASLRRSGYALVPDKVPDLAALFRHDGGSAVSRGRFWTQRPVRNVRYDHTRTLRLLRNLGVEFPQLGDAWLDSFVSGLISEGVNFDMRTEYLT
jgi:thioester reductase-like protein